MLIITHSVMSTLKGCLHYKNRVSAVEFLTRDGGAAGSSLTDITVLYP